MLDNSPMISQMNIKDISHTAQIFQDRYFNLWIQTKWSRAVLYSYLPLSFIYTYTCTHLFVTHFMSNSIEVNRLKEIMLLFNYNIEQTLCNKNTVVLNFLFIKESRTKPQKWSSKIEMNTNAENPALLSKLRFMQRGKNWKEFYKNHIFVKEIKHFFHYILISFKH